MGDPPVLDESYCLLPEPVLGVLGVVGVLGVLGEVVLPLVLEPEELLPMLPEAPLLAPDLK